jgi:nucleoside-diphosphate-sugar epimerase
LSNRSKSAGIGPVLITGGAGFLGRHLAARLDRVGHRVTVLDDRWHRTPDIRHAKEALGFAPGMALRDGLTRTLAFYRELGRAGRPTPASLPAHPHHATLAGRPLPTQGAH